MYYLYEYYYSVKNWDLTIILNIVGKKYIWVFGYWNLKIFRIFSFKKSKFNKDWICTDASLKWP